MGNFCCGRKAAQKTRTEPSEPVKPEDPDPGLQKIKRTLEHDLEKFLLNNILLSVQFFENFDG